MPAPGHSGQRVASAACTVLTVSDTRTTESDDSGRLICELLTAAGHTIYNYLVVNDDPRQIHGVLIACRDERRCQVVLINGGTGLASRDTTYEVVSKLLDKRLDGFGELFRAKSYKEIGPAAMLSRAIAGAMGDTAVFSMPGSTAAVRLAIQDLILSELGHIVYLLREQVD